MSDYAGQATTAISGRNNGRQRRIENLKPLEEGAVGICPVGPRLIDTERCAAYLEGRVPEGDEDFPEASRGLCVGGCYGDRSNSRSPNSRPRPPMEVCLMKRKSESRSPEQPAFPLPTGNLNSCAAVRLR